MGQYCRKSLAKSGGLGKNMKRRDGHIGGMLFIEGLVQTFCKLILRGWKDGPWRTELLGGPKLKGGSQTTLHTMNTFFWRSKKKKLKLNIKIPYSSAQNVTIRSLRWHQKEKSKLHLTSNKNPKQSNSIPKSQRQHQTH